MVHRIKDDGRELQRRGWERGVENAERLAEKTCQVLSDLFRERRQFL